VKSRAKRTFWSAAGSEAPRRFERIFRVTESGVVAAPCHRSPKKEFE